MLGEGGERQRGRDGCIIKRGTGLINRRWVAVYIGDVGVHNWYIIAGRPIMDDMGEQAEIAGAAECQARINNLRTLLKLNRQAQAKLVEVKKNTDKRIKELEERGACPPLNLIPDFLSKLSTVSAVRQVPPALKNQLLLKNYTSIDYNFVKALCESSDKKIKISRQQQNLIQELGPIPRSINFHREAERHNGFKCGLELYRLWRNIYRKGAPKSELTPAMEVELEKKKLKYGENWEKISSFFNGFTTEDLSKHYQKHMCKIETGKWTLRQNIQLIVLVEYYGYAKWALIAKNMQFKSEFQVRERYCNILDPTVGENVWTVSQEKFLLEVAETYRYKWSRIVREVPAFNSKTDNALRRKFRNLMIKCSDEQIMAEVKEKKLAESIWKFKQGYYNRRKTKEANVVVKQEQISLNQQSSDPAGTT